MKHVITWYAMSAAKELLNMIAVLERIKNVSGIKVSFDKIEHKGFFRTSKTWTETVFKLEYDQQ
jgi:hypothetical protein